MKGFKTIALNVILGLLYLLDTQGVSWGLSSEWVATLAVVLNFVMRFFTTTAVGKNV